MDTVAKPHDAASVTGIELLDDPVLNKGTAFTAAERKKHGLDGLLPPTVEAIERQMERSALQGGFDVATKAELIKRVTDAVAKAAGLQGNILPIYVLLHDVPPQS